ncbi:MAG: hypothetical protein QHH14_04815 [Clostridiales bacterium]|nr:hypothetical protein [Clostridiales bacterium]
MQGLTQVGGFSVAQMPSAEAIAAESKGKDKLRTLAEATKAGKIVHGDYFLQGKNIQFHAWVEDMAAKKNLLALEPASGPVADPAATLEPLRLKLMGGLAGVFDPMLKDFLSMMKEPPNFEAYWEYLECMKAHRRGEYPKAVEHGLRAAERDPNLKQALIVTSLDYWQQGQYEKADECLQEVEKSRADLSPSERILLDWLQALVRGNLEAELRSIRQLVSVQPSWTWKYTLASTAYKNNFPQEALNALAGYDPYSEAWRDWSRHYWRLLATACHMLGNHKRELIEARRGRAQFPELLSILDKEVGSLAALGQTKNLQKLFEESMVLPPMSGYSPGDIMLRAGRELRAHGFKDDADQVLNQAMQWFEGRPDQEKAIADNRYSQARTLYVLEKWAEAKVLFEGLRNDAPDNIDYLGYMGAIAAHLGNKEEAQKISKELEDDKRPYLYGAPVFWRARIAALLGDKEGGVNLIRQATKQGYRYDYLHPCEDFECLADYPPYIQLMKPKG